MGKDLRLALEKSVLSEKIKISSTSPELDLNSWENRPEMLKIGENGVQVLQKWQVEATGVNTRRV